MLTGENGLLTKAKETKKATEISKYYEKIELIREEVKMVKVTELAITEVMDADNKGQKANAIYK